MPNSPLFSLISRPISHIISPSSPIMKTLPLKPTHENSDLSNSLSNLSVSSASTTTALQSQRQRESSRPHYSAPAPAEEPLTAPTPTRAPVAPPSVAATPPASAVWNPELGIKFGGPPAGNASGSASGSGAPRNLRYPDANANPPGVQGGKWDGTRGLRFG